MNLQVPKDLIIEIANSDDPQLQSMAQEVKENLLKVQERIRQASQKSDGTTQPARIFAESTAHLDNVGNERSTVQNPTAWRLPSHQ